VLWQVGQDVNSIVADPLFVSTSPPYNLTLRDESPVLDPANGLGFVNFNLDNAGARQTGRK
jgi:hypothetical protein